MTRFVTRRMGVTSGAAISALLLLAAPSGLAAQQAGSQPVPVLHDGSRKVVLPVTVHDPHGDLVTNLQKSDLTLTDDGRPQVIESLTRQSSLPFRVGLLVDTRRSRMTTLEDVRKGAEKLVDRLLPEKGAEGAGGGNKIFLIHFDSEVELLEDFTASRREVNTQLADMGPTSRSRDRREGPETTDNPRERPRDLRFGSVLYDAVFLAADEMMKPVVGRKALVVISDGLDRDSKMGLNEAVDAAERAGTTVYTIFLHSGEDSGGGFLGLGGRDSGLPGQRKSEEEGKRILERIATRTGGRYFDTRRAKDLPYIFGVIADELQGQYLLTYTPDKSDDEGEFHKVVVRANRGELKVMAPEGYFAPGDDGK